MRISAGLIILGMAMTTEMFAQGANFDLDKPGAAPAGWKCGRTGPGQERWRIEADATAPSRPNALVQSGAAAFAWCVKQGTQQADGFVEVKFKPLAGREDQAGGLVWRWQDADNYYVARANALENNVSLYHTQGGRRKTIKYVDAPVPGNRWHLLRVEFSGDTIRVSLNGKLAIEQTDAHITGPGLVGVWTKADSVTAFDDFAWGAAAPAK